MWTSCFLQSLQGILCINVAETEGNQHTCPLYNQLNSYQNFGDTDISVLLSKLYF